MQDSLLKLNQENARVSMGERYEKLDWSIIEKRMNICTELEKNNNWKVQSENFLMFTQLLPSNEEVSERYQKLNEGLTLGAGISQYIDLHGRDPHLLEPLVELREAVKQTGFDPDNRMTLAEKLRPYYMIAFGTGDGITLRKLVNTFQPYHLVIALSDWQDFATSFCHLNWAELSNSQKTRGGRLTLGCYKESQELLSVLFEESVAGLDHAIVYLPPEGACDPKAYKLRDGISSLELNNSLNYLGYTVDEHNMLWNTWQTLQRSPRLFNRPVKPLGGRMVVCGSGPSLDNSLDQLKQLSKTHWITACGSNFRTLKAHNIRVDFLALMERADDTLADIKNVAAEYDISGTKQFMSSTCHHQLQQLLPDTMVFFRPALTPLSVFSNSPSEILGFEGPESINTGLAFAAHLGMDTVVLVGVDLGTKSLDKVRSDAAVGASERTFDLEAEANFGGKVLTSRYLRDAKIAVESCLKTFSELNAINASDGIAIQFAEPQKLDDYLLSCGDLDTLPQFKDSKLGQWWLSSPRYTPERFLSSWKSRRPRAEISAFIHNFRNLFSSETSWSPDLVSQATSFLSLTTIPARQFPRRVLRSALHKLIVAVNRQLIVMAVDPEKSSHFEKLARNILLKYLDPFEQELYLLCDSVESLPPTRTQPKS